MASPDSFEEACCVARAPFVRERTADRVGEIGVQKLRDTRKRMFPLRLGSLVVSLSLAHIDRFGCRNAGQGRTVAVRHDDLVRSVEHQTRCGRATLSFVLRMDVAQVRSVFTAKECQHRNGRTRIDCEPVSPAV